MRKFVRKPKKEFVDTAYVNDETYFDFLYRMQKIATSIFEWVNLPNSMNARWLERCLYYDGQAALLNDDEYGFINTRAASAGKINIYGLPTKINCYSFEFHKDKRLYSGLSDEKSNKDACVLVMNNYNRIPTAYTVELFALRLYEAQRAADVNVKNQKFPRIIVTTESQRLSLKNAYAQIDGNEPVLVTDKSWGLPDAIKSLDTSAPYVADKLMDYKQRIWNEFLTFIGVNNVENEKKERLIAAETSTNNEAINLNLMNMLAPREEACKQFNEMAGLEGDKAISVRVRSDLYNIIKQRNSIINDYEGDIEISGRGAENE